MLIYANYRENDGVDLFIYLFIFLASKEAYPIVKQLEKITVKKVQAKVAKCVKNKSWVPIGTPLGHLSVKALLVKITFWLQWPQETPDEFLDPWLL